jgi:hypothetical protein
MADASEIDDLLDHVNALERRAVALAREQDKAPDARGGWSAAAAHIGARAIRASARRFPLLALAAVFSLGLCLGARLPDRLP